MSEPQNTKDQSMEEILQSIKRIIADEEGANFSSIPVPEAGFDATAANEAKVKGSDILELKDLVEPDPADALASILDDPTSANTGNMQDVLNAIDEQFVTPSQPISAMPVADKEEEDILASIDSLLETQTLKASAEALNTLKNMGASPLPKENSSSPLHFRSGLTVEDLVVEALKPELKQWLNANLPAIVERMVSAEIKKITGQG
jgi:uncharacterized protein